MGLLDADAAWKEVILAIVRRVTVVAVVHDEAESDTKTGEGLGVQGVMKLLVVPVERLGPRQEGGRKLFLRYMLDCCRCMCCYLLFLLPFLLFFYSVLHHGLRFLEEDAPLPALLVVDQSDLPRAVAPVILGIGLGLPLQLLPWDKFG